MRVLVTGSEGHIGRTQVELLRVAGYEIRTFDRFARRRDHDWEHIPGDLCNIYEVRRAVQGVDAVVHLAAIPSDRGGNGPDVMNVNVQGTWNLLFACLEAGVPRVVSFSSVNALGCVGGYRMASYLPIDDDHPHHPMSPYQLSKHLGEEACRFFSERHGMVTLSLRPVFVMTPEHYQWVREREQTRFDREKAEYFAYVDVRDVCDAARRCLTVEHVTNDAFLLTADDTTAKTPTAELVERCYPDTPWKQDQTAYLAADPHRSLIDCSHAKQVLGWQPKHSWRDPVETKQPA